MAGTPCARSNEEKIWAWRARSKSRLAVHPVAVRKLCATLATTARHQRPHAINADILPATAGLGPTENCRALSDGGRRCQRMNGRSAIGSKTMLVTPSGSFIHK
jgi:hypothetical protein